MSTLHAPASVFPFQTPSRVISGAFEPSTGCTTFAPNAAHERLDAADVAEMNAWHDDHDAPPTPDEIDRMIAEHRAAFGFVTPDGDDGFFSDLVDRLSGAPQFPEVVTWKDEELIKAIDLADRRELNLNAVGNVPDRHEAFLAEATAELLRRLERQPATPALALAA